MKITTQGYKFGDGCFWRVIKPGDAQKTGKETRKAASKKYAAKPNPDEESDKTKWWDR